MTVVNVVLILLLLVNFFVFTIALRIFTCCAIYYDSRALGIKKYTANVVLAVFFPVIIGVIHICTRKNALKVVPKLCVTCNATVPYEMPSCPNCGNTYFVDYVMANHDKNKKIAKIMTIIAVICCAITIAVTVGINGIATKLVNQYFSNPNSFFDEFEEFGDNDEEEPFEQDDNLKDFFGGTNPFADFGY